MTLDESSNPDRILDSRRARIVSGGREAFGCMSQAAVRVSQVDGVSGSCLVEARVSSRSRSEQTVPSLESEVAVRIRMKRIGRTHRPFYRICVMHQQNARDGKAIEEVGTYDPMVADKSKRVVLKLDRIEHWVS